MEIHRVMPPPSLRYIVSERSPMSRGSIAVIIVVCLHNSLVADSLTPWRSVTSCCQVWPAYRPLLLSPAPPQQGLREDVEVRLCLKGKEGNEESVDNKARALSLSISGCCWHLTDGQRTQRACYCERKYLVLASFLSSRQMATIMRSERLRKNILFATPPSSYRDCRESDLIAITTWHKQQENRQTNTKYYGWPFLFSS